MPKAPEEPRAGERLSADWGRAVARYLRYLRPVAGPGVKVDLSGARVTVSAKPGGRGGAAAAQTHPWLPFLSLNESGTGFNAYLRHGSVNGIIPTIENTGESMFEREKPWWEDLGEGYNEWYVKVSADNLGSITELALEHFVDEFPDDVIDLAGTSTGYMAVAWAVIETNDDSQLVVSESGSIEKHLYYRLLGNHIWW